jgi:hypothetical protein
MREDSREQARKWTRFIDTNRALFAKTGMPLSCAEDYGRFLHFLDHGYFEDRSDSFAWGRDTTEEQKAATKEFLHAYYSAGFQFTLICLGYPSGLWNAEFEATYRNQS